jgi:DNA-binding transcriptional regulator YiaG
MIQVSAVVGWPTNNDLIAEQLRVDPGFRAEWKRTSIGRSLATALVCCRAQDDLSQRDLAERLGVSPAEVARWEIGETNPSTDELMWLSAQLGIEPQIDAGLSASAE